ncbi:hypothetical protein HK102_008772 [Quaeritorhiza haematococci]|nr:hypothetical protein HK102_008772 [Quaeritorhiza haematococci]
MKVLAVNAGSSSIKLKLFQYASCDDTTGAHVHTTLAGETHCKTLLLEAKVEEIGHPPRPGAPPCTYACPFRIRVGTGADGAVGVSTEGEERGAGPRNIAGSKSGGFDESGLVHETTTSTASEKFEPDSTTPAATASGSEGPTPQQPQKHEESSSEGVEEERDPARLEEDHPHSLAFRSLLNVLSRWFQPPTVLDGIGVVVHRIVHGGVSCGSGWSGAQELAASEVGVSREGEVKENEEEKKKAKEEETGGVVITKERLQCIDALTEIAPLHNGPSARIIRECFAYFDVRRGKSMGEESEGTSGERARGRSPIQIAVYDTTFHKTMPQHVYTLPLPYEACKKLGVRKWGFHGISHSYAARKVSEVLKAERGREKSAEEEELGIITVHLGNGCSICAIQDGKSVETSMGYTPVGGTYVTV